MKKALIIANIFHASPRIPGLVSYFSDAGWQPTLITIPLKSGNQKKLLLPDEFRKKVRIIETEYYGDIFINLRAALKKIGFSSQKSILDQAKAKSGLKSKSFLIDFIFKAYTTFFAYPDEEKKWMKPAFKAARDLLNKEKFDIIISSSSPVSAHIVAKKLKEKYKLPWIADLRDLWTQNHSYPYFKARKIFEKNLELKTLNFADALITVSQPLAENLKRLHRKPIFWITNGFEPNILNNGEELTKKFTITYTGQIYDGNQDPVKVIEALSELVSKGVINKDDLEVNFYGLEKNWFKDKVEYYGLTDCVNQNGFIPRQEIIHKQRQSQILLKLNWENPSHTGGYTGKIFEYLAARRPILATGGFEKDITKELLETTKAGIFCPEIKDIKKALNEFYLEYKNNGQVAYKGDWNEINKFNYKNLSKQFVEVLNNYAK